MGKKGQMLTVFIVLGILIVVTFIYFLAIRHETVNDIREPLPSDASAVQIYVEDCLSAVTNFAVYKLGTQGGYIEVPVNSYTSAFLNVAYAFDSTKTFVSEEKIKSEIEAFVDENLKQCTAGFRTFESAGIKIDEGNVKTTVSFGSKNVMVTAEYPLQVEMGGNKYSIEKFSATVPVAMKAVHSGIDSFVSDFEERYDMTYLDSLDANVFIHPFGETDLFVQENLDSSIRGENYLFLYAVR